jgi:hypothetical protein
MINDNTIRMAREACETTNWKPGLGNEHVVEFMARFAALVAAAEREACARVCEALEEHKGHACAYAIRAREEK